MTAPIERHRHGPAARAAARLGGRVPVIDTRNLQLRGPRIYDFAAYAGILCSDRAEFLGGPMPRDEAWADFSNYVACWMLHGHGIWTIDAQIMPSAGFVLLGFEYEDPEPELGILMTEAAEGQGLALEACEAARDHAFTALGWDSVVSYVDPGNARCLGLMERLGAARDAEAEAALGCGTQVWRHSKEAKSR